MGTAAERAAEVLCQFNATTDGERENYDVMVAALMADPDLLVDLAIEAGGLRPPESVFEVFTAGDRHPSMRGRSDLLERASRPTGEDRAAQQPCVWTGVGVGPERAGTPAWCDHYANTTSGCRGCNGDGTRRTTQENDQ